MRGIAALLTFLALALLAPLTPASAEQPRTFLFIGGDDPRDHADALQREGVEGVQIVYAWRELEGEEGDYDFTEIERDLAYLASIDRALFVQLQDRFFLPEARHLPDYLLTEPQYRGGLARQKDYAGEGNPEGAGWVAMQWVPAVNDRYRALLTALAGRFDGRIAGLNLPESAADLDLDDPPDGFTCDGYVDATLGNLRHAASAFTSSPVVQYVNFWPCEWNNDHGYMARAFAVAEEAGAGIGGPDIVPERRGQMKNSYPFFHRYRDRLQLVAMAVQEPTLTYTDPATGRPFTAERIACYARDYLGVDIIFWSAESPWLTDPEDNVPVCPVAETDAVAELLPHEDLQTE